MYCVHCGKELSDEAFICPACGTLTGKNNVAPKTQNIMALIGFILSFFVAIGGLVCSIIGYRKADEYGGNGKGMATAGIIISACSIALSFVSFIFVFVFLDTLFKTGLPQEMLFALFNLI